MGILSLALGDLFRYLSRQGLLHTGSCQREAVPDSNPDHHVTQANTLAITLSQRRR